MRAFARKIIFFYVFSRILRVYILPEYFHGNWVLNKFDTRLRQLFDESYLLADFLCCCIFFLVELNFLLLEPVVTLCIYRYDKWAKLFHTAVPECLRHSEISPLSIYNLFYFCSCYNGISSREYTVDRSEFFTCTLWILQLSMQNSLPLTNVIQRSSIQKTFYSA